MCDENTKPLEGAADSDTKNKVEQSNLVPSVAIAPTSPGQLQDVTMDNSYAIGYRSPCVSLQQYTGSTSPAQGRSVREFEEQMATLRKENFNLKLRLYFIEESIPGYNQSNNSDGQETLMKQLIDTKVEMEILRKEIQEKQDLLKEAAQALNQMEKIQKDTEMKSQAIIDDLNHKIQYLEIENKEMEKSQTGQLMDELLGRSDVSCNINAVQKIRELEGAVKQSEEKITDFQNQIHKLDEILTQRDQTIRECEDKVKELVFQNSELLEQLDNKDKQIATAERSLQGLRQSNKDLREENKSVNDTFEAFKTNCMRELTGLKIYENTIKCQQETIAGMQSALATKTKNLGKLLERIQDYEKKVTKLNTEKNLTQRENRFFKAIIAKLEKSGIERHENRNLSITAQFFPNLLSSHAQKKLYRTNTVDYRAVYELKEKLCFNISSGSHQMRQTNSDSSLINKTESNASMEPNVSSEDLDDHESVHLPKKPDFFKNSNIVKSQRLREELQEQKRLLADKICMLEETEVKLRERTAQHESACKAIQKLMLNIKNLQDENDRVKKNTSTSSQRKETSANATECSGLCRSRSDTEGLAESSSLRCEIDKVIEQKDSEIRKLKAEVKKKTANLQNLVNKELWEKNREIERLTKLVNKPNSLPNSPSKVADQLKQSFTDTEYINALEHNKRLQKKVDVLIARLGVPNENKNDDIIRQLKAEVKEAREEAERADKWRKECADVCSILTARLEELAGFLDSLLKHKDVLGALAADRRRAMRKAVDRSLDLSKSLNNMSLSITGLSMMDQSLAQLTNLTEILDFSVANKENRTFNSHEELRSETIENLQAELKALKKELDKTKSNECKKDRRSLPITFENHSESEAWSEPDRKVSLARIGLEEPRAPKNCKKERSTDSESDLNQSRSKSKTQEKITQLETMLSQKDERILKIQCELVEADNRLKRENLRVIEMTRDLEVLRDRNCVIENELAAIRKPVSSDHSVQELTRVNSLLAKLQEEHDHLTVEAKIAEMQIVCLRKEVEEAKQKHAADIFEAGEQEKRKLDELQTQLTSVMEQRLLELEEKHQDTLARDWIAKGMYDEHIRQLESLQKKLAEAESTIDYFTENEADMKQSLIDNELAMRALKKNLDETTLQASKAVLERTKALNEKLQLETHTQELMKQIQTLELQKTEMKSKMTALEQQQKLSQRKSSNHGSDVSQSGYTSEEVPVGTVHVAVGNQRVNNSSPDLGIESDAGRVSSVELSNTHLSKLKTVELKSKQMIHEEAVEGLHTNEVPNTQIAAISTITHDCAKVDQENAELRSKLIRTKRALQDTYNKLRTANQRKEQVEKEIKSQILKTHNVLKNVRSNMENEL